MSFPRYPRYKDSGVEWLGSTQALNSEEVLRGLLDILLNHTGLYERLRNRAA